MSTFDARFLPAQGQRTGFFLSPRRMTAQETNKREMVARLRVKVETGAPLKGGVIKTVKLLLINLAWSFFDILSTGTQFVRVKRTRAGHLGLSYDAAARLQEKEGFSTRHEIVRRFVFGDWTLPSSADLTAAFSRELSSEFEPRNIGPEYWQR